MEPHSWMLVVETMVQRYSQRTEIEFSREYPWFIHRMLQSSRWACDYLDHIGQTDLRLLSHDQWRTLVMAAVTGWLGAQVWFPTDEAEGGPPKQVELAQAG